MFYIMVKIIFYMWRYAYVGSSFSSAFANIFLFYYVINSINHNINFFRYIDYIIVFNCENLRIFSSLFIPGISYKNTNSINFSSFLNLKIHFPTYNWLISVYDKRLDFNSLTNWSSCISINVLKNILFLQLLKLREFAIILIV